MSPLLPADWPAPPGVHACTTLRHGAGVSQVPFDSFNLGNRYGASGDDATAVARNRAALIGLADLPSPPHWLRQVHGTRVLRFAAPAGSPPHPQEPAGVAATPGHEPEADASVTATPGVVLAILTADCLPVVFAADDGSEVAVAHAGWRGLAAGVLDSTLRAMRTSPTQLRAWLGPAAGPLAYEVGAEVRVAFTANDPAAGAAFVPTRVGHWRVDLYALARRQLVAAGLDAAAIHGGDRCTISEPDPFFSHRRDQRTGRMATLAWIDAGA